MPSIVKTLCGLTACTSAVVAAAAPKLTTATYDNDPANPLLNTLDLNPFPQPYEGLCYEGIGLANYSLNVVGVMPVTKPNLIYDARFMGHIDTQCSSKRPFLPISIYMGCGVDDGQGDVATVPIECSINFVGIEAGTGARKTAVATFSPGANLAPTVQRQDLSSLGYVTSLTPEASSLTGNLDTVLLDSFSYYLA
ncbi:MAG: hypothetical protein M1828_005931 [Chrysothrix sp. TS-e1954]|nr:MAG: hypothetical protein M1828_005931 [Chrysothrix sp. TS-e1954]